MVEPSETKEHSINYQFKQVLKDRITFEDLDTATIEELGSSFESLQGVKFFDPDIKDNQMYNKKSIRVSNREHTKEVLTKYYIYKRTLNKRYIKAKKEKRRILRELKEYEMNKNSSMRY